ncbi:MAG: patatin-like phospholipase family protein, partial [Gemmatimonadota bacterium]
MDESRAMEYVTEANKVLQAERDHLGKDPTLGLSISGGGIRSASFGMGVLQALVGADVLKHVDYLSTVSGGGYIGSSLTWFLKKGFPDGGDTGTTAENFPFGAKGIGARTGEQRNQILDFIRQHGNYLTPGKGLNLISLVAAALRSIFVSLAVYLSTLTVVMVVLRQLGALGSSSLNDFVPFEVSGSPTLSRPIWLAILLVGVFAASSLVFSVRTLISRSAGRRYRLSVFGQKFIGWIWTGVIFLLVVGSVPHVHLLLGSVYTEVTAGGSTVLGAILGFLEFRKRRMPGDAEGGALSSLMSSVRIVIGAAALIYGLLLAAYALAEPFSHLWWFVGLLTASLFFGVVVNLNYVSLHRMYRDRLMETFLPGAVNVRSNQWGRAIEADEALLETMCLDKARRPFH